MTSWTEAHNYGQERDDEPPPCGGCADLQRRYDSMCEELSEVVLDVPQADGSPALMRCSPHLPDVVQSLTFWVRKVVALNGCTITTEEYAGMRETLARLGFDD
jgi:hypothetical protein